MDDAEKINKELAMTEEVFMFPPPEVIAIMEEARDANWAVDPDLTEDKIEAVQFGEEDDKLQAALADLDDCKEVLDANLQYVEDQLRELLGSNYDAYCELMEHREAHLTAFKEDKDKLRKGVLLEMISTTTKTDYFTISYSAGKKSIDRPGLLAWATRNKLMRQVRPFLKQGSPYLTIKDR